MVIKNGLVLDGDFKFAEKEIAFESEIKEIGENLEGEVFDATGCYVIPGLVDTHFHAAMGETFIDFNEDTAKIISEFEVKNGTTSLVPAISAAPERKMINAVESHGVCNFRYVGKAVFQQVLGLFNALLAHIAHGRNAVSLGKQLAEIHRAHTGRIRDHFVGDHGVGVMLFQKFNAGRDAF